MMGPKGLLIPFFNNIKGTRITPIADLRLRRFMTSIEEDAALAWHAIKEMIGVEVNSVNHKM